MWRVRVHFRGGGELVLSLTPGEYTHLMEQIKEGVGLIPIPYRDGQAMLFTHALDFIEVSEHEEDEYDPRGA